MNGFGIAAMIFCIIVVWVAGINVIRMSLISLDNTESVFSKVIIWATITIIIACCIVSTYAVIEFFSFDTIGVVSYY